ncbi:MAG: bifunctional tetrahydrofolate synthase/dihydrofolate synthase [Gammaproteobacteria bacterium]|nr:bifunctional tetrahydrofolate synthase/dihydrofolate synthase [Gammaproteobacteria bacterium]
MRFDSLAAWLDWQAGLHPADIDLGLDRVRAVWQRLGAPPLGAPVITVAGTNGKGSSVAFAEAMLDAAGYRCACYSSPHLQRYNERIRVAGRDADDATICAAFERIEAVRGTTRLTYFEFGTLAALLVFADAAIDVVVLEVGLGGRLDAVNLVDADVALICSIGLDHQEWLGDDVDAIGYEKAGIMRAGRPAVFSGPALPASVRRHADAIGAGLLVAGDDYRVQRHAEHWDLDSDTGVRRALPSPGMRGRYQVDNAAGVLVALSQLQDRLPLDQAAVRAGLLAARAAGRFDVRPGQPTWILDVAHNPQAAQSLAATLGDMFVGGRRIAVFGMLRDKDVAGVVGALRRRFDAWYAVDLSDQARGLGAAELAERASAALDGASVATGDTPAATLAMLAADCAADDVVVVFGSFVTVGAAMDWFDGSADRGARV